VGAGVGLRVGKGVNVIVGVDEGRGVIVLAGVVVKVIVGVWVIVEVGRVVLVADMVGEGVLPWQADRISVERNRSNRKRKALMGRWGMASLMLTAQAGRVMAAAPYPTTEVRSLVEEPDVS